MLVRDLRRPSLILGSALVLFLLLRHVLLPVLRSASAPPLPPSFSYLFPPHGHDHDHDDDQDRDHQSPLPGQEDRHGPDHDDASPPTTSHLLGPAGQIASFPLPSEITPAGSTQVHTEVVSLTTRDGEYFPIRFGAQQETLNPSIIPHPRLDGVYIVVAQKRGRHDHDYPDPSVELACYAAFDRADDGALSCIPPPLDNINTTISTTATVPVASTAALQEPPDSHYYLPLPIPPTHGDPSRCTGDLAVHNLASGPHDARVLYGPRVPYVIFGSNAAACCIGQWLQDFWALVPAEWGAHAYEHEHEHEHEHDRGREREDADKHRLYDFEHSLAAVEMRRPAPHAAVERNWFLFWDADGAAYAHHDMAPRRAFSRLHVLGGGAAEPENLARRTAMRDAACLARFIPALGGGGALHQATNSLAVTLCRRGDARCAARDDNTVVLALVQYKTHIGLGLRPVYDAYVVAFRRRPPFELFAVARRPLWIRGRRQQAQQPPLAADDRHEMHYVTSMSWAARTQTYHGYLDDVLFVAFSIDDRRSGAIDLRAGDLLAHMGICEPLPGVP